MILAIRTTGQGSTGGSAADATTTSHARDATAPELWIGPSRNRSRAQHPRSCEKRQSLWTAAAATSRTRSATCGSPRATTRRSRSCSRRSTSPPGSAAGTRRSSSPRPPLRSPSPDARPPRLRLHPSSSAHAPSAPLLPATGQVSCSPLHRCSMPSRSASQNYAADSRVASQRRRRRCVRSRRTALSCGSPCRGQQPVP